MTKIAYVASAPIRGAASSRRQSACERSRARRQTTAAQVSRDWAPILDKLNARVLMAPDPDFFTGQMYLVATTPVGQFITLCSGQEAAEIDATMGRAVAELFEVLNTRKTEEP